MIQVYEEIVGIMPQLRQYALMLCCNPTAADDLVQESIARALKKSELFTTGTSIRGWVFTIMHNVHVSSLRRGKLIELPMDPEKVAVRSSVQPGQELTLEVDALIKAMKGIPETQRDAVLMVDYEGMTYEDTATHLNISIGTESAHGMGSAAGFALTSDSLGGFGNTISSVVGSVDGVGVARPTHWMETQVAGGRLSPGFQTSLHRAEAHEAALFFVPQAEAQTFYALP